MSGRAHFRRAAARLQWRSSTPALTPVNPAAARRPHDRSRMKPHVLAMPGAEGCADRIARKLGASRCSLESRRFPDGETYVRVADDIIASAHTLATASQRLRGLGFAAPVCVAVH